MSSNQINQQPEQMQQNQSNQNPAISQSQSLQNPSSQFPENLINPPQLEENFLPSQDISKIFSRLKNPPKINPTENKSLISPPPMHSVLLLLLIIRDIPKMTPGISKPPKLELIR